MWPDQGIVRDFLVSLVAGLLAGFVIFLVALNWSLFTSYLKRKRAAFRRIFGVSALKEGILTITLDTYQDARLIPSDLRERLGLTTQRETQDRFFKTFPDNHVTFFPGVSDILGYCSSRAAAHLINGFRDVPGIVIKAISDKEVASQWNGTFINVGSSASNIKTDHVKHLSENTWLLEDMGKFVFNDGQEIKIEDRADKGIILKLTNPYFPGHSVLVCTGLGEWGTSGAAWFLSAKWQMLSRRFRKNPFLIMVSVTKGSDESAREDLCFGKESLLWRVWS